MQPRKGLVTAPFHGGMAVLDLNTDRIHVLGSVEGWLASIPDSVRIMELAEDFAAMVSCTRAAAADRINEALATLESLRLVEVWTGPPAVDAGRSMAKPVAEMADVPAFSGAAGSVGRVHSLMGARIAFRSVSSDLLDAVDEHLDGGPGLRDRRGDPELPIDRVIELEPGGNGEVVLRGDDEWCFPSIEALLAQLDQVIDDFASRIEPLALLSGSLVVLADGSQILVTGPPVSNQSAVVGALIARGAAYAGRGLIGLSSTSPGIRVIGRRFRLQDHHRELLENTAEPSWSGSFDGPVPQVAAEQDEIDEVWVVSYDPSPFGGRMTGLGPIDALSRLSSATVNLPRLGSDELELLCALAESATVTEAVFDDPWVLAKRISDRDWVRPAKGTTVRQFPMVGGWRPRLCDGVSIVPFDADGHRVGLATVGGSVRLLDPLSTVILMAVDGEITVDELAVRLDLRVREGLDHWAVTSMVLLELVDHGFVEAFRGQDALPDSIEHLEWPDGPWVDSPMWFVNEPERWGPRGIAGGRRLVASGIRFSVSGDEISHLSWPGTAETPASATRPKQIGQMIEIEELPGGLDRGVRFVVPGFVERWVSGTDAVVWAASLTVADRAKTSVLALPPLFTTDSVDGINIFLEPSSDGEGEPHDTARRVAGLLLGADGDIFIPHREKLRQWLDADAPDLPLDQLYRRMPLESVTVPRETTDLGCWIRAFEQLHGHRPAALPTFVTAMAGRLRTATPNREIPFGLASSSPAVQVAGTARPSDDLDPLLDRIRPFGEIALWDESVKIDSAKITPVRPLYRIDVERFLGRQGTDRDGVETLAGEFEGFGLPATEAAEAAAVAIRIGEFHLGEERSMGGWRRKLYVWTVSTDVRPMLSDAWAELAPISGLAPSWVAWKFASGAPETVIRSVDLPYLNGADTVTEAIESTILLLPAEWREALKRLFAVARVDVARPPVRDDAVTIEDGGRYTTDISVRGPLDVREGWRFEAAVRWVAAVAGHTGRDVELLIRWVRTRRMSNVIFGTDGDGEPFVNLYMGVDRDPGGLGWSKPVDRLVRNDDDSPSG